MKKFTLLIQSKCEKNDRKRKYKQRTAWTDTADQMLLEVCVDKIPQRERDRVTWNHSNLQKHNVNAMISKWFNKERNYSISPNRSKCE